MKNGLVVDKHGNKTYYLNNKPHRENGPAIIYTTGTEHWCLNGELHREDGPAVKIHDGDKIWYVHGKRHRVDGPAVEVGGTRFWYLHGTPLTQPKSFDTMEDWLQELNDNEEYSLQWISDINGLIKMIKEPSGKQTRLHAMRWKI